MKEIFIFQRVGEKEFAENKDIGRDIRVKEIMPQLEIGEEVVLNFEKIARASQSFIHSLVSDPIRKYGVNRALELVAFKSCNNAVKQMIGIVLEYMQDALNRNKIEDNT